MAWSTTQTVSPVMTDGYAKNMNARVIRATFRKFIPVPPNISLANITENATAMARIQSGVVAGTIRGMMKPDTKNPS